MSLELRTLETSHQLNGALETLKQSAPAETAIQDAFLITQLGGGLLQFAGAVYPDMDVAEIYGQVHDREPQGRGAHFDVYESVVHKETPWAAVYNLAGHVSVKAAMLPEDLASSYAARFPDPTTIAAYQARREYSAIALLSAENTVATGNMQTGSGFVLLQRETGPHIIHDIVPTNQTHPGGFVKLVRPASKKAGDRLTEKGYQTLDDIVTRNLQHLVRGAVTRDSGVPAQSSAARASVMATRMGRIRATGGKRPCSGYD